LISRGEAALKQPFNNIPATVTLEYKRTGSRAGYEHATFPKRSQLWDMVLAEMIENKGRFTDHIVDGIWSICEESFWGVSAHISIQKAGTGLPDVQDPIVDLFSAETGCLLAWTDYLMGPKLDKVSKLIRPRIYYEANRRIFTPMLTARYKWMSGGNPDAKLNNWAPWIMSNYTAAALLLEKDEAKRNTAVNIAMKITDQYINGLGDDGGCEEGPGYWFAAGAATFDVLSILHDATGGKMTIFHQPLIKKMAAYIYNTHVAGTYFINIADAHAEMVPDGMMIYRFGKAVNNEQMAAFGSWAFHTLQNGHLSAGNFYRTRSLYNLFAINDIAKADTHYTEAQDVWYPDLELMASRTHNGLFVAAHGGNNGESHNHNDVGDFMVYADGSPVIIDVGSGAYTARTFSKDRYKLWFNTSAYHNLPTINNQQQGGSEKFKASNIKYTPDKNKTTLSMDIQGAYPADAGINKWQRQIIINKSGKVEVTDSYQATAPVKALTQTFMTVCPADISTPGKIIFSLHNGKKITLDYNAAAWSVSKEKIKFTTPEDEGVKASWHHQDIYRLLLTAKNNLSNGQVKYIIHK